jgi:hypothetical protein
LLASIARVAPLLIDIGAAGAVTGALLRRAHRRLDEVEALARCRLDDRPREQLHTRITLYA